MFQESLRKSRSRFTGVTTVDVGQQQLSVSLSVRLVPVDACTTCHFHFHVLLFHADDIWLTFSASKEEETPESPFRGRLYHCRSASATGSNAPLSNVSQLIIPHLQRHYFPHLIHFHYFSHFAPFLFFKIFCSLNLQSLSYRNQQQQNAILY